MKLSLLFGIAVLTIPCSFAQTFENVISNVSFGNYEGKIIVADLDNDGYPEIIESGSDRFSLYKNSNGAFNTEMNIAEFRFNNHVLSVDAGDVNLDGFMDILQSGNNYDNYQATPYLITNKGSGQLEFKGMQDFPLTSIGTKYLGDYEGDGDLDVISSDLNGILLNRRGTWISGPYFPKYNTYAANWCNLDDDATLEAIQVVVMSSSVVGTYLLQDNLPAMAISTTFPLPSIFTDMRFADYDADGDLDLLTKKIDPSGSKVRILNNEGGNFNDSGISFEWGESIDFGDMNNDGLYDVVVNGTMIGGWMVFETAVYINNGNGTFTKLNQQISSYERATAGLGDIDGDGDLDIIAQNGLLKNQSTIANTPPVAPGFTGSNVSGTAVELFWEPGGDDKTPLLGLTYNIEVRDENGQRVVSSHSLPSGKRQIFKLGNAYNKLTYQMSCLKQGTYTWRVQTLDASYQGSSFSAEKSFSISSPPPVAPGNLTATTVSDVGIRLTWSDVSATENAFVIFRKPTDSEFEFYPIDTVEMNSTSYLDTLDLQPETSYTYRVASSNCAYLDEIYANASATTFPPPFVNSGWLDLGKISGSFALLGDYDNDRDLDLVITYAGQTRLFRFDNTGYVDSGITFGEAARAGAWMDNNRDGYLDLLLVGSTARFYENAGGTSFKPGSSESFPNVNWQAGISMGDYDNNGSNDMLVQAGDVMRIYTDEGNGIFTVSSVSLPGYMKSSNAWADFDNDGDLDILANKKISCNEYRIVVFENKSNTFVANEFTTLTGINDDYLNFTGDMEWGDYDSDGYPDILVAGQDACGNGSGINRIYRNQQNRTFVSAFQLKGLVYDVEVAWCDHDNDGDLDVFAYGDPFSGYSNQTRLYRNEGNRFRETKVRDMLQSTQYGKAVPGDIDNDGDLDYVILGQSDYVTPGIAIYRNMHAEQGWNRPNHVPSAPTGLQHSMKDEVITLSWIPSTDFETKSSGLTYNLYVVNDANSVIMSSHSLADGHRSIVSSGNVSSQPSWKLKDLPPGTYRWAVQAIDNIFSGSAFSEENTFIVSAITATLEESPRSISTYPNPVHDFLTIASADVQYPLEIEIRNTMGQLVSTIRQDVSEVRYDMTSFPQGVYYFTIRNRSTIVWTRKVIKQ